MCAPMPQGARRRMVWLRRASVRGFVKRSLRKEVQLFQLPGFAAAPGFRQSLYADDSLPGAWHWLG